jgi:predicted RNase H-like HicB family nuclease
MDKGDSMALASDNAELIPVRGGWMALTIDPPRVAVVAESREDALERLRGAKDAWDRLREEREAEEGA